MLPTTSTRATILRVALLVAAKLGTVQSPVLALYEPTLGLLETSVSPAGNWSRTTLLTASEAPSLVRVMVYVMFCPTTGAGLLTVFCNFKSALCVTANVAVLESLFGVGSLVLLETLAVLLALPVKLLGTAKVVCMVRLLFGAIVPRLPRLHGKAVTQAPVLLTKVMPLGVMSVTTTSAALLGPRFRTVMV